MRAEQRSRDGDGEDGFHAEDNHADARGAGVRSSTTRRTPSESPDFRPRATAEVLLLDDANARAAAAYNRALCRCRVVRNLDVARRYGLSSDTVVRDGTRVLNGARLLQGTRAEFEATVEELRLEHIDVWGDDTNPPGGDPLRAARAVVKAASQFTDRAMDAEAAGTVSRDDAEALSELAETMRRSLKRLDAALLPVLEGRRR